MSQPGSVSRCGVKPLGAEALVVLLEGGLDRVVLIDSRSFVDFNTCHILESVNVNCSKLMKRRLQQDKVQIQELLQHSANKKLDLSVDQDVVVYDQSSSDSSLLGSESFLKVLLVKLERSFPSVHLLSGGFSVFSRLFPGLCEGKSSVVPSCLSEPCLTLTTVGPTRILPHLYLGCQRDVLNKDLMQKEDIAFVLNASNTCPRPDFIPESHFLRVPVNDSFCDKILPWLDRSVDFIERAKSSDARVLVHCLAGISRSATIAIGYIMKRMDMNLDEAYRFVKEKRPTISPNFNFLGQLLDFEKKIKSPNGAEVKRTLHHYTENCDPGASACVSCPESSLLEPLSFPCVLSTPPEDSLLAHALSGLQIPDGQEDSTRLKRSFSLDIKSYGESCAEKTERYKPSAVFKEPASKPCQFSPVEEVSEQSTPEQSPDKDEETDGSERAASYEANARATANKQQANDSTERNARVLGPSFTKAAQPAPEAPDRSSSFVFGLSRSQQHLARPGCTSNGQSFTSQGGSTSFSPGGLKGWHSDILLGPVTVSTGGGWYLSSESRFYSTSSILSANSASAGANGGASAGANGGANAGASGGANGGANASYSSYVYGHAGVDSASVRRRHRTNEQRGDSRRSWHEESSFEKQLKRRSCHMELGDLLTASRSREEMGKVGSGQSSFSGSMEVIEVS